jgi:uncharacterized membrane protein YqjE
MDKRDFTECLLFAGLRLIAIALLLVAGFGLVFQLMESWYRFDPTYLGAFLLGTIFRPVVTGFVGFILFKSAPGLARRMAVRVSAD